MSDNVMFTEVVPTVVGAGITFKLLDMMDFEEEKKSKSRKKTRKIL